MTLSGWIFMVISWAAILGIFVFCIIRATHPPKHDDPENPQTRA